MNSSWFWRLVLEPTIRRPLRSASPHSWLDVLEDRKLPDIRSLTSTTQEVPTNNHPIHKRKNQKDSVCPKLQPIFQTNKRQIPSPLY